MMNRTTISVKPENQRWVSPGKGETRANVAETRKIGEFELRVLLTIVRLNGNAYAPTIQRELGVRTNKDVCLGAIYVTLDRLEKRGLIASYRGEPTKVRGGGPKRMVKLEPDGVRALKSYKELLSDVQQTLDEAHLCTAVA